MKDQTIFTTGQVAKICKVAPRTVSKWFDSGRLRGYHIPGSTYRRIPRENLIKFMAEHKLPMPEEFQEKAPEPIVVDDKTISACATLRQNGFDVELVDNLIKVV